MKKSIFACIAVAFVLVLALVPSFAFAAESEAVTGPVLPVVDDMDVFVPLATSLYIGPAVGSSPSSNSWGNFTIDLDNTNFVQSFNSRFFVYSVPKVDIPKMPSTLGVDRVRLWFDFQQEYFGNAFGVVVYAAESLSQRYTCSMTLSCINSSGNDVNYSTTVFNSYIGEFAAYSIVDDLDIVKLKNVRLTLINYSGTSIVPEDVRELSNLRIMFFSGLDVYSITMSSYAMGLALDYNSYLNDDYNTGFQNGYSDGHHEGYESGYAVGTDEGYESGYDVGYSSGKSQGYTEGYNKGTESASSFSFFSLISAIVDVPINAILSLFNFEIFGFNLQPLLTTVLTLCVALAIIRLIL